MIIELIILIAIVMVPVLIVYRYSCIGVLGELSAKFPMEKNKNNGERKWVPFIVEQYGHANNIFVSNAKLGVSKQRLHIRYIFPFSLIIRGFDVPESQIVFEGSKRRYGMLFRMIKIEGIESGCLMFPELFLSKNHELFLKDLAREKSESE